MLVWLVVLDFLVYVRGFQCLGGCGWFGGVCWLWVLVLVCMCVCYLGVGCGCRLCWGGGQGVGLVVYCVQCCVVLLVFEVWVEVGVVVVVL